MWLQASGGQFHKRAVFTCGVIYSKTICIFISFVLISSCDIFCILFMYQSVEEIGDGGGPLFFLEIKTYLVLILEFIVSIKNLVIYFIV